MPNNHQVVFFLGMVLGLLAPDQSLGQKFCESNGLFCKGELLVKTGTRECIPGAKPLAHVDGWSKIIFSSPVPPVCGQPNFLYHPNRAPDDPRYREQSAHRITEAELAWDLTTGDPDVVVAVIGTGIDTSHPELAANIWLNPGEIPDNALDDDGNGFVDDLAGWDFVDEDNQPFAGTEDHETKVAGVLGAVGNNGLGGTGILWHTAIMPLRINFTSEQLAAAIHYAIDNGAQVLNLSLGIYLPQVYGPDSIVGEALQRAEEAELIVVASAGNEGTLTPQYPAANPTVLGVGSTNDEDMRLGISNAGWWVDVAAPGQGLLTTANDGGFLKADGTSFSAPYVSGIAALIRDLHPDWNASSVRQAIMLSSERITTDWFVGYGRVNARAAANTSGVVDCLARIRFPENKGIVSSNSLRVAGTAVGEGYRLEWKPTQSDNWTLLAEAEDDVVDSELAKMYLGTLVRGSYHLRLTVRSGVESEVDQVTFVRGHPALEGWPAGTFGPVRGSPKFGDLDGDGLFEILAADSSHFIHGWTALANPIWFGPLWTQERYPHTPALGDLDGDGRVEIVACAHDAASLTGSLYVWRPDATLVTGWPRMMGYLYGKPVLADLMRDGTLKIVVIEDGDPNARLHVVNANGSSMAGFPLSLSGRARSSPVVADLDGDRIPEIMLATSSHEYIVRADGALAENWPRPRDDVRVEFAAADFDNDGRAEFVSVWRERVELVDIHAVVLPGWPRDVSPCNQAWVALGDLDGDWGPELVVGLNPGDMHVWRKDGVSLDGWPHQIDGTVVSAPLIADLDADGAVDVALATGGARVHAWTADGSPLSGFPIYLDGPSDSSAAVVDLDADGEMDMILGGSRLHWQVYGWALGVASDARHVEWGQAGHDPHNTAYYPRRFRLEATGLDSGDVRLDWETPQDIPKARSFVILRGREKLHEVDDHTFTDVVPGPGSHMYLILALDESGNIRARSVPAEINLEGEPEPDGGGSSGNRDGEAGCACRESGDSPDPVCLCWLLAFGLLRGKTRRPTYNSKPGGS